MTTAIDKRRGLQLLFGFYAVVWLILGVCVVNPLVVMLFSVDRRLSSTTLSRVVIIEAAFIVLALVAVAVGRALGRGRTPVRPGAAKWVGMISFWMFLLLTLEGVLAVRYAPVYLPSASTNEALAKRDDYLGYRLNPAYDDQYHINSWGFRGPEPDLQREALRIVCLGDSITFGFELGDEEMPYPMRLERMLHAAGLGGVDVVNGGVPGYASLNVRRLVERVVLPLQPAAVIVCVGWNDMAASFREDWHRNWLMRSTEPPVDDTPVAIVRAARTIAGRIAERRGTDDRARVRFRASPNPGAVSEYAEHLAAMAAMCRERGVYVLFLNLPTVGSDAEMSESELQKFGHQSLSALQVFQGELRRVCERDGVPFLGDIFNVKEGNKDRFFWDYCHPTADGCREIARRLLLYIMAHRDEMLAVEPTRWPVRSASGPPSRAE